MFLAVSMSMFNNPLFWAVLIGWVLSLVLHEFAHGVVAYWGGDYTIKERGGMSLNPLQYLDPVHSILVPVLFLSIGGIPLPGGVNYVRRDLIRSKGWDAACSLAGPAMDFLVFLACMLPMHPSIGLVEVSATNPSGPAAVLATLGLLQFISMVINLLPVPPLDGFQTIAAYMDDASRDRLLTPQVANMGMIALFLTIWFTGLIGYIALIAVNVLSKLGFGASVGDFVFNAWQTIFYD